ncbi:MAG: phage tail protein [Clostridium sp.]|nr:phage tail protein [Clostridium sp.]
MEHEYAGVDSFVVRFYGQENESVDIGFARISNLEAKMDYEVIQEGGNSIPILLPVARKEPDILTLERGIPITENTEFWRNLKPGTRLSNVNIFVIRNEYTIRWLSFAEGIVISKQYPDLNAVSSEVYIEKLQIAHSGLEEVE